MKRSTAFSVLALCVLPPVATFAVAGTPGVTNQILYASPSRTALQVDLDEAALQQRIAQPMDGEQLTDGLGLILAIAGHGAPAARVLSWETGGVVMPAVAVQSITVADSPDDLAVLGRPAIFHDLRVVRVGFRPLLRDANGNLSAVNSVTLEVTTSGSGGGNEMDEPASFSSAFYPLYRAFVSNLDEAYPEHSIRAPGRFLVLATQNRFNSFNTSDQWLSWLDLKKRKGYTMQIVSVAVATGQATTIAQTIRNAYQDPSQPDLEYVMIIGDVPEMSSNPRRNPEHEGESSVGDNSYYTVAGDDSLPDLLGGRVSALVPSEYVTYWNKVYQYEANPVLDDPRWFRSVCAVAGNYSDGTGLYPVTPVWNVEWARQRLLRDGCVTDADTFYYHGTVGDPAPGQYRPFILADIDSGVCAILYRGWGGSQGWQYPVFNNVDLAQLHNGRRMPAVFGIVCGSGNFAYTSGQCLGETFTTGTGTPSQPQGGIIYIGASDLHTNTRHNNAILAGIIEAMLDYDVRSAGALLVAGKLEGWRQFPLEQTGSMLAWFYVLHVFNLLGDPEIQLQICQPGSFSATLLAPTTVGTTLLPVTVTSNGQPTEGAVVTLRAQGSDTVSARRTDATGQAWLPANFTTAGVAQLTVWKSGCIMELMDIPVTAESYDPKITAVNWSAGGDNLPNPGELVSFTLDVRNESATQISAIINISQWDQRLTIWSGFAWISDLAPGATATTTPFVISLEGISLEGELFDGERPQLTLVFQEAPHEAVRYVEVPVAAPDPVITTLTVNDGNGILEPGETADIFVTLLNAGHQAGSNLSAEVHSHDDAVNFVDNSAAWASLPVGQSAVSGDPIRLTVPAGVTPGRQILLRFVFSQEGVVVARKNILLNTGVVTPTAPTGPDEYGYYAYENIDAAYAAHPTYDWIELDPEYGGSGADTHTVRDDTHFGMALPAAFTFYGQSYDSVWICSNGWLAFERTTLPEFRNWQIPSPIGPGAMVCPFWDDLIIDRMWPNNDSAHTVWTRYDAPESRFVVQWRALNRAGLKNTGLPNEDFCTFEAILMYRAGDGDILCQYDQIANVDAENNYATVGIQDSYHRRGLGLTYANIYLPSVDTLRAGRAILFTTTPPDQFSDAPPPRTEVTRRFALHEAYPNPFNPRAELRFELSTAGRATLVVYDILGQEVATLVDGTFAPGSYQVSFDGRELPSGLYFARLISGANTQVRKLMLVK
ncbi:MAG: C25 family cysteine peptidase [bacterium]|nr:C25 family cysteine peptidase [bacterium]